MTMKHKMTFAVVVGLCGLMGLEHLGLAELPPAAVVAQMKGGTITAVGKDEIQVDGHTLRVKEKAEIVDHKGQPMSVEEIHPNGLVKYLLKAGQIEMMIVTNPQ
jgi:hypothetical protein